MRSLFVLLFCFLLTACPEKEVAQSVEEKEVVVAEKPLKACTKEMKICPDGSGVSRNGANNCEFDACPKMPIKKKGEPMMCTQEVKQCPDGSFVGRDSNNNCAFSPCPKDGGNLQ